MDLFVSAGAKYFVALAQHHDNFDIYNSRFHEWNSVKVGPKRDIMAVWAKEARKRGLRFGVSNHGAHAWHWLQVAYDYDPEGPMQGVRYDAYTGASGKDFHTSPHSSMKTGGRRWQTASATTFTSIRRRSTPAAIS